MADLHRGRRRYPWPGLDDSAAAGWARVAEEGTLVDFLHRRLCGGGFFSWGEQVVEKNV